MNTFEFHVDALKSCQLQMTVSLVIKTDQEPQWWSTNGLCYGYMRINTNYERGPVIDGLVVKKMKH